MVDRLLTVGRIHSFIAGRWQPANLEAERVRFAFTGAFQFSPRAGSRRAAALTLFWWFSSFEKDISWHSKLRVLMTDQ